MGFITRESKMSNLVVDADLAMGAHAITINSDGLIDGKDVSDLPINPNNIPKIVSDDLRHSHDAVSQLNNSTYAVAKTITFTNGIIGTLRIKFKLKDSVDMYQVKARLYKNGEVIIAGTEWDMNDIAYINCDQDLDVGVLHAGDTLELWTWCNTGGGNEVMVKEWRIYYTNQALIAVAGVTS